MAVRIDRVRAIVRRAVSKGKTGRKFADLIQGACNHALGRILDGAPPKKKKSVYDPDRAGKRGVAKPRNRRGTRGCRAGYWENFTADSRRRNRAELNWKELWRSRPSEAEAMLANCVADVTCLLLELSEDTRQVLREPLDTFQWIETTTNYLDRQGNVKRATVKSSVVRDGGLGLVRGFWTIVYRTCRKTSEEYFRRGHYEKDWPDSEGQELADNRDAQLAEQSRQDAIGNDLIARLSCRKDGAKLLAVLDCLKAGLSARRIVKAIGSSWKGRQSSKMVERMIATIRHEMRQAERFAESNLDWIDVDPVCDRITPDDQRRQPTTTGHINHWYDDELRQDMTVDVSDKSLRIQPDDPIEYFDPPIPTPQRGGKSYPIAYYTGRLDQEGHIIRDQHAADVALNLQPRGQKIAPVAHNRAIITLFGVYDNRQRTMPTTPLDRQAIIRGHNYAALMARRQSAG